MNINRDEIDKLAYDVRKQLCISTPVSIDVIRTAIVEIGGSLSEEKNIRESGKIEKMFDNRFCIKYKSEDCKTRQLFTVAHELGHLYYHMGYGTPKWANSDFIETFYKRFGTSIKESEADEFAGAFLMPKDDFEKYIKENAVENSINLEKMAEYFNVSKGALLIRGGILGYFNS